MTFIKRNMDLVGQIYKLIYCSIPFFEAWVFGCEEAVLNKKTVKMVVQESFEYFWNVA